MFADPPQVTLSLGSTLNPDDIKEGDDVYFECHIKANPKEQRITWSRDVSIIPPQKELVILHKLTRPRTFIIISQFAFGVLSSSPIIDLNS